MNKVTPLLNLRRRNDRYKSIGHSFHRNPIKDKKSKRFRILKSLILSDDKECHQIHSKMVECKKFNIEKISKDYKKYFKKFGNLLKIENPKTKEWRPINDFRDRPKYIGQYIHSKDVCQSLWCPNCRKFLVENYRRKIINRINNTLLNIPLQNKDFKHISGVLGLTSVNINEVKNLIKKDTNNWRRIRYRVDTLLSPKNCPFIETVYEIELVNWEFLQNSKKVDFKSKQIQQLIDHQKIKHNLFLFVHFHSITNLSKEEINLVFQKDYFVGDKPLIKTNKENGLYVQNFKSTQTLEENIDKLTSYPFKDPIRFKHSFVGNDYRGPKEKNYEFFEYEELSQLIKIYHQFQKRNWRGLFRTVEHHISVDLLKYSNLFPNNHLMWSHLWSYYDYGDKRKTLKYQKLDYVWVVDRWGNVYKNGWNPNNFFPNKNIEIKVQRMKKEKIGEKVLDLEHPLWDIMFWKCPTNDPIMKNIYKQSTEELTKTTTLEGFYYSHLYGELKRGKLFIDVLWIVKDYYGENKGIRNINKFLSTLDNNKKTKFLRNGFGIKGVIPKNIEFDLTDPNITKRLEVLKRLSETDKI
ncbi:hypothetical protein OAS37_07680, partial [Alphaproteobacteria bacterium]|nr:hypothetical protein [Alphaproteobacteria bacterium]